MEWNPGLILFLLPCQVSVTCEDEIHVGFVFVPRSATQSTLSGANALTT